MSTVHFIDTSVLVELLNIPNMNANHAQVKAEYQQLAVNQDIFVLPIATLVETGNHIGQIKNSSIRYDISGKFSQMVTQAVRSENHWNVIPELSSEILSKMMSNFPNWTVTCSGFGDLSIVEQFEDYWQNRQPIGKMRIWSLDHHLAAYAREGGLFRRKNK